MAEAVVPNAKKAPRCVKHHIIIDATVVTIVSALSASGRRAGFKDERDRIALSVGYTSP
jgi:hypothetical protein